SLGQHFLISQTAIRRIVEAIPRGANILEIGPGRGAITEPLLQRAGELVVIEKDDRFAAVWNMRAKDEPALTCVHADVLAVLDAQVREHEPLWIAGNLPYNISGPLSAALFAHNLTGGMVLMYQREVGNRIMAGPGSKVYGGLSVLARHFYDVKRLLTLPPGAFSPPPKVHSVVLLLTPHGRKPVSAYTALQQTVRKGFAHRRKTIANNFRGILTESDWRNLGVDPKARPEQLGYATWSRLACLLSGRP
ncbi:MAG: 16S rRNA (adenine(1518)-N(6)/adenine(1519)-N(6))-dimethyltransferase RsmA, partial [Mariprofundaceae bacterium]|nr:16S rRNA (adenine(1518)-N(6)/adenine(1519)-N(6))-dimethyltransferase RsmA [Mariprofundaceae bacterium]